MEFRYDGSANKSGVYRIINNVNGKFYIGSAKLFKTRARQHLSSLNRGTHHNKPLQGSFDKYGDDAFSFEVLEVVPGMAFERKLAEQKYVSKHFVSDKCLNLAKNTIQEIGPWSNTPEETSRKRGTNSKKRWANPQYKQELREKISAGKKVQWADPAFREKVKDKFGKRVAQIDPETNAIIAEYPTTIRAGKIIGVNFRNISAVCIGTRKTAGGFGWKFI